MTRGTSCRPRCETIHWALSRIAQCDEEHVGLRRDYRAIDGLGIVHVAITVERADDLDVRHTTPDGRRTLHGSGPRAEQEDPCRSVERSQQTGSEVCAIQVFREERACEEP